MLIVLLHDVFFEFFVLFIGDDSLVVGFFEIEELLTDTGIGPAFDFRAAAAGVNGQEDDGDAE